MFTSPSVFRWHGRFPNGASLRSRRAVAGLRLESEACGADLNLYVGVTAIRAAGPAQEADIALQIERGTVFLKYRLKQIARDLNQNEKGAKTPEILGNIALVIVALVAIWAGLSALGIL